MFSSNTDSLGYHSFKGASWAFISGLHLGDTFKGLFLLLGPCLIPMFGLASWACTPIISNPISTQCLLRSYLEFIEVVLKDQNIGKHGYIGNWILRKYW